MTIPTSMSQNHTKQTDFLATFEPLRPRLSAYISALVRNREEAQDLMSETVLLAYERFGEVRSRESFVFFLFTIARRLYYRSERRRKIFTLLHDEDAGRFSAPGRPTDADADVRLLYDALAKLPARQREAIALFDIAGLPLEEVRTVQGGTLSGVKTRLKRGREKLAQLLGVRNDVPHPPARPEQQEKTAASADTDDHPFFTPDYRRTI